HRADLFAVGVIAHELLTGKRLFDHPNDFEIITMLREMPIQPPSRWNPSVTLALDDIVLTALSRDPGLRWQSAGAMRAALVNLARDVQMAPSRERLAKWTEWAFTQAERKEDGLSQVIQMLGDPSDQRAITVEPDEMLTPTPVAQKRDPTPPTVVGSLKLNAVSGTKRSPQDTTGVVVVGKSVGKRVLPVQRETTAWGRLIFLLLLLVATAGGAYWYLFLRQ
ncbi:MAG TPA: hypothetical protein VFQ65_12040, partial [Kofleriaceae bacterium]|nr:hypothetical protein [Kofleriaceae bacterium]